MLSNRYYNQYSQNICIKPINYKDYVIYEHLWDDYINTIVLPAIKNIKPDCVRMVICESCPKPSNNKHPHPHYIFNNINNNTTLKWPADKYLDQVYKGIICTNKVNKPLNKLQIITDLLKDKKGSVVILDILPTHGVKLNSGHRKKVSNNPKGTCDIMKLVNLFLNLKKVAQLSEVNVVFATPPSLNSQILSHTIDKYMLSSGIGICINWNWPIRNINTGQGHTPSWRALCKNVRNGY